MRNLVLAELLKLRSTRITWWILLATLAVQGMMVAFSIPKPGEATAVVPLGDPGLLASLIGTGLLISQVLVVVLGVMAFTQEHRHGTITSTYLLEPRRARVIAAKLIASVLASAGLVVATLVVVVPPSIALVDHRGGDVTVGGQFWQVMVSGFGVFAATAAIGVAVGALVRHQIPAVVGVLVWMTAGEHILIQGWPTGGRWLLGGVTMSVMNLPGSDLGDDHLLPAAVGGLAVFVYAAVAVCLALTVTPRRDVL